MLPRTPVAVDATSAVAGSSTPPLSSAQATSGEPPSAVVAPTGEIEAYMNEYSAALGMPPNLTEAIRYSFLGPGKRMRPLLAWHSAAAVGADPRVSLAAGTAVELIHAFSLVHDDLPGIDNDDLRRGRPTLHKQTSEAMAILAGDAMLTLGFQILMDRVPNAVLANQLMRELATGTTAMISGQVYDTLGGFGGSESQAARLKVIHENKTGALIRAACRMGALCGVDSVSPGSTSGKEPAALTAISAYADAIGLMFQVVDDLLDVTQTTLHLGKKSGKDIDAGKLTFPGVHGVEKSRQFVRELHQSALAAIASLGPQAEPLRQLASYMAVRTR